MPFLICNLPGINPVTLLSLDKTRSIQNRQISEMDGTDGRGQGSGEVRRRRGAANAFS